MIKVLAPRAGACLLLATTAAIALTPVAAWSQTAQRVAFDIKPGSTAQALNDFARQAGVQILFPYDVAAGRQTEGLKGDLSRDEALRRLIAGSRLELASESAQVITLRERTG